MGKYSIMLDTNKELVNLNMSRLGFLDGFSSDIGMVLTSAILEAFHPLLSGELETSSENINRSIRAVGTILGIEKLELDNMVGNYIKGNRALFRNVKTLLFAINEWIATCSFKPESKTINSAFNATINLQLGLTNASITPMISESIKWQYSSDSLVSLAWCEIFFTIEKGITGIKSCPFCGKIYRTPKNNPDKSNCGLPDCRKKYLIWSHGGIEGYREWERTRKRKQIPGNKPVGRPQKKASKKEGV